MITREDILQFLRDNITLVLPRCNLAVAAQLILDNTTQHV